jgi:hypothetical protein
LTSICLTGSPISAMVSLSNLRSWLCNLRCKVASAASN